MELILAIAILFGFRIDATTYAVPAAVVSDCGPDHLEYAYIDTETWVIYGDQDSNGRLDGDDCHWR